MPVVVGGSRYRRRMRFAVVIPYAAEREFVDLARLADAGGWDAVFTWESVWGQDAWATLGAAAVSTSAVRLGTLLTPAARYRPWDLASRVATADRLRPLRESVGLAWEGYDVVVEGDSHGAFGSVHGSPGPWAQAGATWWVESWWALPDSPAGLGEVRRRIALGPPR